MYFDSNPPLGVHASLMIINNPPKFEVNTLSKDRDIAKCSRFCKGQSRQH